MPTTSLKPEMMGSPMHLAYPPSYRPDFVMISILSEQALGVEHAAFAGSTTSITYPAASRILAFPFMLLEPYLVQKVWWMNGATATTDSADVGVFTEDGATKLVSAGSTAIATASVVQEVDVTDTVLPRGRYWCAYIQGGTTATPAGWTTSLMQLRMIGCVQQAGSGSTLGSTLTPAAVAAANINLFGIAARTQVA